MVSRRRASSILGPASGSPAERRAAALAIQRTEAARLLGSGLEALGIDLSEDERSAILDETLLPRIATTLDLARRHSFDRAALLRAFDLRRRPRRVEGFEDWTTRGE